MGSFTGPSLIGLEIVLMGPSFKSKLKTNEYDTYWSTHHGVDSILTNIINSPNRIGGVVPTELGFINVLYEAFWKSILYD